MRIAATAVSVLVSVTVVPGTMAPLVSRTVRDRGGFIHASAGA
jgi:hypothetical protein